MTNGSLTTLINSWEDTDRSNKITARVQQWLLTAVGAAVLTVVPADFGWNIFKDPLPPFHDSAGATFLWTYTYDAAKNIVSAVTVGNPAAGVGIFTARGF